MVPSSTSLNKIGDNYFSLVKKALTEKWNEYGQPSNINDDDLAAGTALFTKIAAEGFVKESEPSSLSASHEISLEKASLSGTDDKIKAFVEGKAYDFKRTCQTGFPFSLLQSSAVEIALKHALEGYDSILSHFLMLEGSWMSEGELDERFGIPFQRLQTHEIQEACSDLKTAYVRNKDNKAGFYLLWLIKRVAGCSYEIPEKSSFNDATVVEVLSKFFTESGSLTKVANFVEILHYRRTRLDRFLYQKLLDQKSCSIFLNFVVQQLIDVPMDRWSSKADIITDLFETVVSESKLAVAKLLVSSKDPATSKVGSYLLAALKARSLREAIPYFIALKELLPNINYTHIEIIFGRPFVEFRKSNYKKDLEFTKRLNFNAVRKAFVHGSLMMGVYASGPTFGGNVIPSHLLAYDMNTEKMVWGIPLKSSPSGYTLSKAGERLLLQFAGEKKLHFIHPETGELDFDLELPEAFKDKYDCLHVSTEGFAYQMVSKSQNRILIGGKVIDSVWCSSFETKIPSGSFRPLSTHCGFLHMFEERLALFGPTGDQVTIEGCIAAKAKDNKLYLIEKDPAQKDKCLLTIRTLKEDAEVVSGVEKSISLNVKGASFGEICQNGQLILFTDNFSGISPVFVDLNSCEVTYSPHKFPSYAEHVVNVDSGELWTWDLVTKKIWKVSSANIILMGSMESSRGTTLLYADKADRLYFVDIPF